MAWTGDMPQEPGLGHGSASSADFGGRQAAQSNAESIDLTEQEPTHTRSSEMPTSEAGLQNHPELTSDQISSEAKGIFVTRQTLSFATAASAGSVIVNFAPVEPTKMFVSILAVCLGLALFTLAVAKMSKAQRTLANVLESLFVAVINTGLLAAAIFGATSAV